jgi:hypothetical protein
MPSKGLFSFFQTVLVEMATSEPPKKKKMKKTPRETERLSPNDYPTAEDGACPLCFLKPCIVVQNQNATFLGRGNVPSAQNPAIRRDIYKRFWRMIANSGGWHKAEYIHRKITLGAPVNHKREVMPECVLKKCRGMYPNLPSQPYMDHLWQ